MVENQRNLTGATIDTSRIEWIWIDLDDTLIDFHTNSRRALARLYTSEGLDRYFPSAEAWTEAYEAVNRPLWKAYGEGHINMEQLRNQRFLKPLLSAGCPSGEAAERALRYDTLYLDLLAEEKQTNPGAHDTLELLRARGYNIGVLSNGFSAVQHRKIASAGLNGLIDLVVLSEDAGVPKPHPEIFRYAMDASGVCDPRAHAMTGDNFAADVEGALAAGWTAIWYNPASKIPPADPHSTPAPTTISSLSDLIRLFPHR